MKGTLCYPLSSPDRRCPWNYTPRLQEPLLRSPINPRHICNKKSRLMGYSASVDRTPGSHRTFSYTSCSSPAVSVLSSSWSKKSSPSRVQLIHSNWGAGSGLSPYLKEPVLLLLNCLKLFLSLMLSLIPGRVLLLGGVEAPHSSHDLSNYDRYPF